MLSATTQENAAFWIASKMHSLAALNEAEEGFAMTATGSCLGMRGARVIV